MRMLDANRRRDKYEVYLVTLQGLYATEVVEGEAGACMLGCHVISIVHFECVRGHGCISFIVFCDVEVACHNGRTVAYYFLYLSHDEFSTFLARSYTDMVKVCVNTHEYLAAGFVFKFYIA